VDQPGVALPAVRGRSADLWTKDGRWYGPPKDWDTEAIVYNSEMLESAPAEALTKANQQVNGLFG
jgi:multiple sugar transport system substrate-binding protein